MLIIILPGILCPVLVPTTKEKLLRNWKVQRRPKMVKGTGKIFWTYINQGLVKPGNSYGSMRCNSLANLLSKWPFLINMSDAEPNKLY